MSDTPDAVASKPLHVVLLADASCFELLPGVLRHLCVGLFDEAVRVSLVCHDTELPASFPSGPLRAVVRSSSRWTSLGRQVARIRAALAAEPPMLVHAFSARLLDVAKHLAAEWDTPAMVNVTGLGQLRRWKPDPAAKLYLVVPTDPLLRHMRETCRCPPERCFLVRPGLHAQEEPGCFRDATKLPAIMTTQRLDRNSGVDRLIRAFAEVLRSGREAMLFIIGVGPAEPELRGLVRRLKLGHTVTFAGQLSMPLAAVQGGDVVVLSRKPPQLTELPLAAMGAGLAIVAPTESVLDFLVHERTALLYPEPNETELANQIRRLLEQPEFGRQLAANGLEHIRRYHTVSMMVRATRQLYDRLTLSQRTFQLRPPSA
jgi:glycosyltransferase involved in cell wall biosynthesis